MNKYGNIKKIVNGHTFDSIAESRMYQNLLLLEKAGKITHLTLQPSFELIPSYVNAAGERIHPLTYRADFQFYDTEINRTRVVDCKGFKTKEYRLKKKLFDYQQRESQLFLEEDIRRLRL